MPAKYVKNIVTVVAAACIAAATTAHVGAASASNGTTGLTSVGTASVVAQARGRVVHLYASSNSLKPFRTLRSPSPEGVPLVFLVKERGSGRELVYLPSRPNGSTAWVVDREVELALDPYRVDVSLGAHTLSVFKGGRLVHREQAGVGRSVLPTPKGTYYIVALLKQPDPHGLYGPYAFGLSAHSNVLYSFGGGPGQIGIHGTNEPWALGANVSHGCVRISNSGIATLARMLPLGTPVIIRD